MTRAENYRRLNVDQIAAELNATPGLVREQVETHGSVRETWCDAQGRRVGYIHNDYGDYGSPLIAAIIDPETGEETAGYVWVD